MACSIDPFFVGRACYLFTSLPGRIACERSPALPAVVPEGTLSIPPRRHLGTGGLLRRHRRQDVSGLAMNTLCAVGGWQTMHNPSIHPPTYPPTYPPNRAGPPTVRLNLNRSAEPIIKCLTARMGSRRQQDQCGCRSAYRVPEAGDGI